MRARKSLNNWLVMSAFLLSLVSNANAQSITNATEEFETNDFSKFTWTISGDASWSTTRLERHSGSYGAKSGSIEDGESTTLQIIIDCLSGDITFYRKVSSESVFDYLKFYIDGLEKGYWSGTQQVLWNCQAGSIICEAPKGAMNFAIGCSGTRNNGRWFNEPDGWWEHQWKRVSPRSLYYRQLEDRLGTAAVENVTTPEQRAGSIWSNLAEWAGNQAL